MSDAGLPQLLGLHRLVETFGEGHIPELLALVQRQGAAPGNDRAEWPGKDPVRRERRLSTSPASNDNVIQFRPHLLARIRRRG